MRVRRMFVIKIVSDPYRQQIQFQCWDDAAQHWQTIDDKNNDSSELVRTDIQKSFFPFQAERIVDLICEEYSSSQDKLALVFEGPPDEYADLQAVCALDKNAAQVALQPFQRKLENASTIWPCIARLAEDVRSRLVALGQHDAALDAFCQRGGQIPVCVIGAEHTGKSTFVNALMGAEILPANGNVGTTKIYKIQPSAQADTAAVCLHGKDGHYSCRVTTGRVQMLNTSTQQVTDRSFAGGTVTQTLQEFLAQVACEKEFSDIVEIEAPFSSEGLLGNGQPYVIFDAAGSSSITDPKARTAYWQNLGQAMQGFTDVLPLVITDGEGMKRVADDFGDFLVRFSGLEALDLRFTMLVVNKADTLDERELETPDRILDQDLPYRLHPAGVWFVSSVMGLGAKNGGVFLEQGGQLAGVYGSQQKKYANPQSRHYKQWYKRNILSPQIKARHDSLAQQQTNLVYVNSGLYHVERMLADYAEKYILYARCKRAQEQTNRVLLKAMAQQEQTRQAAEEKITVLNQSNDAIKQQVLKRIAEVGQKLGNQYRKEYSSAVAACHQKAKEPLTEKERREYWIEKSKELMDIFLKDVIGAQEITGKQRQEINSLLNAWNTNFILVGASGELLSAPFAQSITGELLSGPFARLFAKNIKSNKSDENTIRFTQWRGHVEDYFESHIEQYSTHIQDQKAQLTAEEGILSAAKKTYKELAGRKATLKILLDWKPVQ